MAIDTSKRPSLEERYLTASNTSDLTVRAESRGAVDLIAAAGFVKNQLGSALIHLRGEWDRCDKPRKATAADIAKRAQELPKKKGRPDTRRAEVEALVDHARAMRERASRLSGRSVVVGLLTDWALLHGVDCDLISPALFHWLAPACHACEGRGKVKIPDAPSLSAKTCQHCQGDGKWPRPLGALVIHERIATAIGQQRKGTAAAFYGD